VLKCLSAILLSLLLVASALAARHAMPVGQRLENLRGNRKIDLKLVKELSKISDAKPLKKKKRRTYMASAPRPHEILIAPIAGFGVESRYDRIMSQLHRRQIRIVDAGVRQGRATILVRIATARERDDLVDILYRSQGLVQVARAQKPRNSGESRFARMR
jgi:hypothetical protein